MSASVGTSSDAFSFATPAYLRFADPGLCRHGTAELDQRSSLYTHKNNTVRMYRVVMYVR
jgi:hypothetical protein